MSMINRLKKEVPKVSSASGRKKGASNYKTAQGGKQSSASFQKTSPQPKLVSRGLRKTASIFSGFRRTPGIGKSRRKAGQRALVMLLCLAVIGGIGLLYSQGNWIDNLFSQIGYFEVGDNVVINGCHVTTPDQIRELGAIRYHTNLFDVNPAKMAAVLVKHPWISSAKIQKVWPNKLVINIVEHVPEALIVLKRHGSEELYYMDAKGIPFVAVKPGQDLDFPVMTGLDRIKGADRRQEILHDAMLFLKLVGRNNPNLPSQSVSEIHFDATHGMTIYLVEYPFPIYFGLGGVARKYRQLEKVLGVLYKPHRDGMQITQVKYIRMDYLTNKVLVAQTGSS